MSATYTVRPMTKEEISTIAVDWAAAEGWNPGLYDATSFYATDPQGFYVGLLNNEPIACISTIAYDNSFGFLGFYIVKKDYRGKGYGLELWIEALKHLPTQNIGLDGVVDQQENYKKSGFKFAYRNIRHEGLSKKFDALAPEITEVNTISLEEIIKYDTKLFPTQRKRFLENWLQQTESHAFAYVKAEKIQGYGMIRKCTTGYKIGPLFADNNAIALELFKALSNSLEVGTIFYLDTPEVNPEAVELAQSNNMHYVFETARMYTKEQPAIDLAKVFGVTTFELG